MNDEQLLRYSRQIMLPQLNAEGQQRLIDASVLVIGAGGLGCPAAMYLASSGIGKMTLVDYDDVELSNLQRQIAHHTDDIGKPKVDSLQSTLQSLNPDCKVTALNQNIDRELLDELLQSTDVVLDCTDNFETRFLINAACVVNRIALVSGAAIRFEGQLMVYDPKHEDSPCYRCIYPESGETEETCSENGVISPLVGIIGSMQALEATRLLTETGESSSGKLLVFDGLTLNWRTLNTARDPDCPACGEKE